MKITSIVRFQANPIEREFWTCIRTAVSKFGDNKAELVFSRFESEYNLSRNEIFERPDLFVNTLRKYFRFSSSYVERAIISEACEKFSLPLRHYNGLSDVISEIKKSDAYLRG
jgi:hypothetical protein